MYLCCTYVFVYIRNAGYGTTHTCIIYLCEHAHIYTFIHKYTAYDLFAICHAYVMIPACGFKILLLTHVYVYVLARFIHM